MKMDSCSLDFLTPEFLYKALRPGLSWETCADKNFWESEARKLKCAIKTECVMNKCMKIKTTKKTVTIQRYAATTRIADCRKELWEWLRMNEDEVRFPYRNGDRYPNIGDLPHDVWCGSIGAKYVYAKTLDEVVEMLNGIA